MKLAVLAAIIAGLAWFIVANGGGRLGDLTGDDLAQLAALLLIGSLVASGVLASRQRGGTMAAQALAWLLVIVALVAGYEYRTELSIMANRVTSGLIPGAAITTRGDGATTVTLTRRGASFITAAKVNGTDTRFVVDTGATTVVLTTGTAAEAGLDMDALRYTIPVATANGMTEAAAARVSTIEIGGILRRNVSVLVARDGQLFENLLGINFLDTLSAYEVRGNRMVLTD